MKKLVSLLFVLFVLGSVYAAEPDSLLLAGDALRHPTFDMDNCTCKNIPLFGKVEVKSSCADFKVEVVTSYADLRVEVVDMCQEGVDNGNLSREVLIFLLNLSQVVLISK